MKFRFFCLVPVLVVLLAGCSEGLINPAYRLVLPELPLHWQEILGEPHWRVEWIGEDGCWEEWEGPPGSGSPEISLPCEWSTPVFAWPFWPEWNLAAGLMRPSGALFPWDVSGEKLGLSWMGGVDAVLWKELARASSQAWAGRLPWYFDWPRFRELFETGDIPEAVRKDPWLADWKEIGTKTVQSGFDRRRIVSRKFAEVTIPGLEGNWAGSSPFAEVLQAPAGGPLCLKVTDTADTWVSAGGILKCSSEGWVLRER